MSQGQLPYDERPESGAETLHIMVVDDEPGMVEGVRRVLERTVFSLPEVHVEVGLRVSTAASGEEALERIEGDRPDILLLDHQLGGITGLEVLERLAEKTEQIRVIMITAYASLETAVTAIKRGAWDFLAKPFTPGEVRGAVRKAAENLIVARQARRLAQERRQVRFQFISVLAHELKAPIAAVQGYLELIENQTAGADVSAYGPMLGRCQVRLEGMRKLILDLLDLTRIESGQRQREVTAVDVTEVARQVVETMTPMAQERGIAILLEGEDSAVGAAVVQGDRSEVEIILNNLVSNAVKYNRDNGRVDVKVSSRDGKVEVAVRDTGIGMTPGEAGQLFQDFKRIKNAKTVTILGSGLGLSIVKKLSYLYDGDVRVESEPDVGSTFTVTLSKTAGGAEPTAGDATMTEGS